jgi:4-hydroxy-2-oxoheptanedioate aldolase
LSQPALSSFKQRLRSGQNLAGIRSQFCSSIVAEALGFSGIDYVYIDMEHSPNSLMSVLELCQALAGTPAIPVVRLPTNDHVLIQQLLDVGIENLVIPMVEDADEARSAASATRYPPKGVRSVARVHRGNRYGRAVAEYERDVEDRVCLTVQIESRAALGRLAEIVAVEGVDAVLFGPGDLAADFGHFGKTEHPEVLAAISEGIKTVLKAGKLVGMSTADPALAREWFDAGCRFVSVGGDIQMLMRTATQAAAAAGAFAIRAETAS